MEGKRQTGVVRRGGLKTGQTAFYREKNTETKQAEVTAGSYPHVARSANCLVPVVRLVCCAEQVSGLRYQPAM